MEPENKNTKRRAQQDYFRVVLVPYSPFISVKVRLPLSMPEGMRLHAKISNESDI